jgi:hypothetical protein
MILTLPGMIYRYFAAQADSDFDGMAACFAPTASVRDGTGGAQGLAAIRDWLAARAAHGRSTQILPLAGGDDAAVVLASVVGDERRGRVEHRFRFEDGMIAALELC